MYMVFIVFTQLQIYEDDFKREKREKESLQQQLRAKHSTGVSQEFSAIHFVCNQLGTKYGDSRALCNLSYMYMYKAEEM